MLQLMEDIFKESSYLFCAAPLSWWPGDHCHFENLKVGYKVTPMDIKDSA